MFTPYKLTKKDKRYVDISLAFVPSALNSDITTLTNERAINNSIKNAILTVPLEVPFNRNYGSRAADYLFDVTSVETAGLLYLEIERSIKFCEPRVKVEDIVISIRPDQNSLDVLIQYKIIGSETIYEVQTILTPTR